MFVVNGVAQTLSSYWTVSAGPSSLPSSARWPRSPSHSLIQPASANSAVQGMSSVTRSMSESSAASRRAISSRWASAVLGSGT